MKSALAALVIVGLGSAFFVVRQVNQPQATVPQITTDHLHPLVQEAIAEAVARVEADPRSAEFIGDLGTLLLAHELYDDARTCLHQAAALDPDDATLPYLIGYSYEHADYEQAMSYYETVLTLRPDHVPLQIRMAQILMRTGELDRADQLMTRALELEPDNPYALMTRGRLAMLRGDLTLAQEHFQRAAAQPDWSPQPALEGLTTLAIRRGDHQSANRYQQQLATFPEVAKMEFSDPILSRLYRFEGLGKSLAQRADLALARGDLPSAIAAYESFIDERSDMPSPYLNLAQAYRMSGRLQEAAGIYENVLRRFGDSSVTHGALAQLYQQAGRPELAIRHFRQALEAKPDDKQAWFLLGMLHEQAGRIDEALSSYEQAVSVDPSYPQAQLALGVLLLQQQDYAQARVHIARAVALVPGDPVPQGYLREVDQLLQQSDDAPQETKRPVDP